MQFISVTGRRVWLNPIGGRQERKLLQAVKDEKKYTATNQLLRECFVKAEPEITDFDKLSVGEETDLLFCLRLMSLGPTYEFRATCPDGHSRDYQIDIRELRRFIQVCGDPSCSCHKLYAQYSKDEEFDKEWIRDGILTADWTAISPDHLEINPPNYKWTLPISQFPVSIQLPQVKHKGKLGGWTDQLDIGVLSKSLALMTVSLGQETIGSRIEAMYDDLLSIDRYWLRDRISDVEPGIDSEISVKCISCGIPFMSRAPLGSPFFMPKRAPFPSWFPVLFGSARETGITPGATSWTGLMKSETAS